MAQVYKDFSFDKHWITVCKGADGKYYLVDTCDTFDMGWETMVFKYDVKRDAVPNYIDLVCRRYLTNGDGEAGHRDMCVNLDMMLRNAS